MSVCVVIVVIVAIAIVFIPLKDENIHHVKVRTEKNFKINGFCYFILRQKKKSNSNVKCIYVFCAFSLGLFESIKPIRQFVILCVCFASPHFIFGPVLIGISRYHMPILHISMHVYTYILLTYFALSILTFCVIDLCTINKITFIRDCSAQTNLVASSCCCYCFRNWFQSIIFNEFFFRLLSYISFNYFGPMSIFGGD